MKVYIDAIEDEYPFTVYSHINQAMPKNAQQLFVGATYITYAQINNNFAVTWAALVGDIDWPTTVHGFAASLHDYSRLADALAEFIEDVDDAFPLIMTPPSFPILTQYELVNINHGVISSPPTHGENNLEINLQAMEDIPDGDPEITTLEDLESTPPSRAPTLGY